MTLEVRLREEAANDLAEASSWYERQLPGLGGEFLDSVQMCLQSISDNPNHYPQIYNDVRRVLLPRFPFGIFYKVMDHFILVFAVMHGSRNPRRWRDRT